MQVQGLGNCRAPWADHCLPRASADERTHIKTCQCLLAAWGSILGPNELLYKYLHLLPEGVTGNSNWPILPGMLYLMLISKT
eukprot:957948-Pelagomonas_calceolata.AAC.2